jgi:deoxyribonuclease-4
MAMKNTPLLGAHMSIAGGLHLALERGHSIGCNTIQIFTRNSTRWTAREVLPEEIITFRNVKAALGIDPVFAHCSYLINLAGADRFYERSIFSLVTEVERAEHLGLPFVILHPGAHLGSGETEGLKRTCAALNRVLAYTSNTKCKIVIENTAGQGSCIGCKIEHLAYIYEHVQNQSRIGFCIDTCHLFASGYDIRTKQSYRDTFKKFEDFLPISAILAFHLNDSKRPLGSGIDRHEHIGKGQIGRAAFHALMNDKRFHAVPKVLETPKGKDLAEDVVNLKLLRSLIGKADSRKGSRRRPVVTISKTS